MYKMIVGDNAIGNLTGTGTSLSQIERPPGETILVIESGVSVPWMKPSDFPDTAFQTAIFAHNEKEAKEIIRDHYRDPSSDVVRQQILGGKHRQGFNVLFADGVVKTFDWSLSLSEIEAMSRINLLH
jgi:prepilin-type processing-associated H-X9-DG protein